MKSLAIHPIGILLCCSILIGCASIQEVNTRRTVVRTPHEKDPAVIPPPSPQSYLSKAAAYETKGDLRMALFYLQVATSVSPEEKEISERFHALKNRIHEKAESHFKEGVAYYRQNRMEKARQSFLNTLRYNPGHQTALHYLKSKMSPFKTLSYKAEKGEAKTEIADKLFHDADKAFLISYFYKETDHQAILPKGMDLILPYLEPMPVKQTKAVPQTSDAPPPSPPKQTPLPAFSIESELARADGLLKDKRYDEVLVIADKILDHDYLNPDAEGLTYRVYYQKGKDLFEQGQYLDAQTILRYVDPEYISTEKILAQIQAMLEKQAEAHYLDGVKFFINEELKQAIGEWETVLKLNPAHEKARSDIQNAKQLLQKLQNME